MSENTRIGDSRLRFGLEDVAWGYLQSVRFEKQAQKAEAQNGAGNVVAVEYYGVGTKTCSGSFYYIAGASGPVENIGTNQAVVVVDGEGEYYIERVTDQRSVGQWQTIDFEGTFYPHLVNS